MTTVTGRRGHARVKVKRSEGLRWPVGDSMFTWTLPAVCLIAAFLSTESEAAATWSYDGHNGPHHWHRLFPQACSGKYQSPIDIQPASTRFDPSLNHFAIWYDPPRPGASMVVSNNGHTVQVVTKGELYVANGGLPYVYRATQFHFHWGHAHHHGSEHLIDNQAFPLELHIVSYNSDLYSDVSQAVTEKQGLAILAVLFQISAEDNEALEPIISAMEHIKHPEAGKQVVVDALSLRKLLPPHSQHYYRYNGSLTTPGCFESVLWTVFANPAPISRRQLHKFRQLKHQRRHHGNPSTVTSSRRDVRTGGGRERRATRVLDELAMTSQETARFRRHLTHDKTQASQAVGRLDEENAGKSYHRMLEAVHGPRHPVRNPPHNLTSAQHHYVHENLVNNFRPVQPINDRVVFRSFVHLPQPGHSRGQVGQQGVVGGEGGWDGGQHSGCDGGYMVSGGLLLASWLVVLCCFDIK